MTLDKPYFMTNKEWYYFDVKELKYKLTKEANEKAVKSYKEFYKELQHKNSMADDAIQKETQKIKQMIQVGD